MRYRHVAALLILGALLNLAGPVHAQRPQPKSPEERYEDMNKSPFLAATLEWIIPTVGHDYAGDREAGMPAVYLLLGGLGVGFVATGGGHGVGCNHDPGKLCAVLPFVAMAAAGAILGESRLGIRFGLEAGEQNQCVLPAASRPRRRGARPVGHANGAARVGSVATLVNEGPWRSRTPLQLVSGDRGEVLKLVRLSSHLLDGRPRCSGE